MRNLVPLKMLSHHGDVTKLRFTSGADGRAVLLTLPTSAFPFDLRTYPNANHTAVLVAESQTAADAVLRTLGEGPILFKVDGESGRLLTSQFDVTPEQRFISYTSAASCEADPDVTVFADLDTRLLPLFAMNGFDNTEVEKFFSNGAAGFGVLEDSRVISAGMVFPIGEGIWEIGAIRTVDDSLRRGLAAKIVRTAISYLHDHGRAVRYQIKDDNLASAQLAEACGLTRFLVIEHFLGVRIHQS